MIATVIIALIIAAVVAAIIVNQIKERKSGKFPCGSGCAGCAMFDICHKH